MTRTAILLLYTVVATAQADPSTRSTGLPTNTILSADRLTDFKFAHLTTTHGLAMNSVVCLLQDHRGFMWIGTGDGLNRYDGHSFVVYKNNPNDRGSLSANFIRDMVEDDNGQLWIAVYPGVNKFDPTTERTTRYLHDPNNRNTLSGDSVWSVTRDSRGYLWFATADSGLDRFDPATETFTHYSNDSDGQPVGWITRVIEDTRRDIWFVGERGLFHLNVQTGQIARPLASIKGLAAGDLYEDKAADFWMLVHSPTVGLAKYERQTGRLTQYPLGAGAARVDSSRMLDEGGNGFWVPSSLGLSYFDRRAERFTRLFRHDDANPNSLSDNSVVPIYRDRAGLLWVGTQNGGLNILNFQQQQFSRYTHRPGEPYSLSPGKVTAIYEDSDGVLWVVLFPSALDRLDRKMGTITHYLPGSENKNNLSTGRELSSIFKDARGHLWLGSLGGGLYRFDERTGRFKHYGHNPADPHSLQTNDVVSLYGDPRGHLWVGVFGGVSRLDPATDRFTNYRPGPVGSTSLAYTVSAMHRDRSGTLWLGTWGGVLSRFDEKTNTFLNYTPDLRDPHRLQGGSIGAIHEDRTGTLWLASGQGLYRYDRQKGTFNRYTETHGLPNVDLMGILEDRAGRLWISSKKGISRFDPQTETFRNYDVSDGLHSNEFSRSCYQQGGNGQMFFCSSNGITGFSPESIRDNPYVPPVVVTSFKIFNKPVPIGAGLVLKQAISYIESLTLLYSDNVFSFEFAALSYANSHKNRYRYKLEEFEAGWNEVGSNQRLATYTNLDPGKYVFRVQGSNSDGVWNDKGASLTVFVAPPWWRTKLFGALSSGVAIALLWVAYQLRIRQLQREFKKLQDVIETIPAMAWTARPDGSRAFVNRRWTEYTGLSAEDTASTGWKAAVHPEDRESYWEKWRASLATGEPFEDEARFCCAADGGYRWFLARGVPMRDKHGTIVRWYGILTDIEDRKRAEEDREKLRQLEADLAHINRVSMMGELAASIAHEVNQPLSGIVSNGSACLRWLAVNVPNLDEAREAARRIVRDGKRAGEVIARIRALTKRASTPKGSLDLNETIREVLVLVGDKAKRENVSIQIKLAGDLSPVSGDQVQLQQVVLNLVMNAIEAMSTVGERPRELRISTRNIADQVQVTVEDSGPGIDPNTMAKIFEPFYTTKSAGMGMGLSISRSIVQSHGGQLWVTANDGPGTVFHFTLMKYQEKDPMQELQDSDAATTIFDDLRALQKESESKKAPSD